MVNLVVPYSAPSARLRNPTGTSALPAFFHKNKKNELTLWGLSPIRKIQLCRLLRQAFSTQHTPLLNPQYFYFSLTILS